MGVFLRSLEGELDRYMYVGSGLLERRISKQAYQLHSRILMLWSLVSRVRMLAHKFVYHPNACCNCILIAPLRWYCWL